MYIVNKHGVTHLVVDGTLTAGSRKAIDVEIAAYETLTPVIVEMSTAAQTLAATSAIAERDVQIAQLQAALAKAKK